MKICLSVFPNKYHRQEKCLGERAAPSLPPILGLEEEQEEGHDCCAPTALTPHTPTSLSLSVCVPQCNSIEGSEGRGRARASLQTPSLV